MCLCDTLLYGCGWVLLFSCNLFHHLKPMPIKFSRERITSNNLNESIDEFCISADVFFISFSNSRIRLHRKSNAHFAFQLLQRYFDFVFSRFGNAWFGLWTLHEPKRIVNACFKYLSVSSIWNQFFFRFVFFVDVVIEFIINIHTKSTFQWMLVIHIEFLHINNINRFNSNKSCCARPHRN